MNNEDKSKIDELNKSLYSRNAPEIKTKRKLRFHEQEVNVNTDWEHPKDENLEEVELNKYYKDSTMSFFTKILVGSIIFFLIALGIGSFLLFKGANIVSGDNVDISINGPVSVSGGEPASFDIQISNQNNIKLETVDFSVDFPSGTIDPDDTLRELKNTRKLIDDINPGGVGNQTIKAILYGEENSKKEIKVSIEYRVKGSDAVFKKEKSFDILISSSPLTLTTSTFKEVNSGQEFEITVTLNSNSKETIKNLILKAIYPFGFTYVSSNIDTLSDTTVWKLGDIPPGGKKTLKIKGKLEGQDDEMRVFRFMVGSPRLGNEKVIGTEYISSSEEVAIKKPFMTLDLSVNGESDNEAFIASFNNPLRIDLSYFNNLPSEIIDGEILVKMSGSAFDKESVNAKEGLYKSASNEIVWNGVTTDDLNTIDASGGGRINFSLTPRDFSTSAKPIVNPNIKFVFNVKGKRVSEDNVPETIISTLQKEIRISSNISISGQTLRSSGPFTNTGPIPPKTEQDTTYTIVWTIDNTANNVSGISVESSLPPDVKWLGKVSPSGEDISYDPSSGRITWNAGSIGTYTAGTSKRKQVSFQVSLNPDITQVNSVPTLVNQTSLVGEDDFTGETLKSNLGSLTTRFSTDSSFKEGDEKVVR